MRRRSLILIMVLVVASVMQVGCNVDCADTTVTVQGQVVTPAGDPVPHAVIVISNPNAEKSDPVYLTLLTGMDGRFTSDAFTVNGCDPFDIFVNADRFTESTVTFSPSGEGELDLLPESLTITLQPD